MVNVAEGFAARLPAYGPFIPQGAAAQSARYNFADDFDLAPVVSNLSTTGQLINTGAGAWWAQAMTGSAAAQTLGTAPAVQPNHPGVLRMRTSAVLNAGLAIKRAIQNAASGTYIRIDKIEQVTVWFAVPVVTNIRLQIGIDVEPANAALTDGAVLILDTSQSPNFLFSAAQQGQVQTVDSGIKPDASSPNTPIWWRLDILQAIQGIYQFRLNETPLAEINRAAFAINSTNVGAMVQTLVNASTQAELQLDFYSVTSNELNRYDS